MGKWVKFKCPFSIPYLRKKFLDLIRGRKKRTKTRRDRAFIKKAPTGQGGQRKKQILANEKKIERGRTMKMKIVGIGLLITAMFLFPSVPLVKSEVVAPDLIITGISVTDGPLQYHHYITVWVKNQGNWPAGHFTTKVFFEIWDTWTGLSSRGPLFEHESIGCKNGWTIPVPPLPYDQYWVNPDPDRFQRRYSAMVDYYDDVQESNETNNWNYTAWMS
jgi:hypothetical protein